jgi:hypothetical protein
MNLPNNAQIEILAIKLNEIEESDKMPEKEKMTMKKLIRQKLKKINIKDKL